MLNNFLCADALITSILVVDGLFCLGAIGLLLWFVIKNRNKTNVPKTRNSQISKVDDDTYLMESDVAVEEPVVYEEDNNVVHFVNQITDINEELNNELNANTVVVNHAVEMHVKKPVAKDEIENFVVVGGEKKTKTEEEIATSANRGTHAFRNATNFINTINSEQKDDKLSSKKVVKKK